MLPNRRHPQRLPPRRSESDRRSGCAPVSEVSVLLEVRGDAQWIVVQNDNAARKDNHPVYPDRLVGVFVHQLGPIRVQNPNAVRLESEFLDEGKFEGDWGVRQGYFLGHAGIVPPIRESRATLLPTWIE